MPSSIPQAPPWPLQPLDTNGTRAEVSYGEGQAHVCVASELSGFARAERRGILSSRVEVRMLLHSPLLIFLVSTDIANFDAPFCSAINGEAWHRGLIEALETGQSPHLYATFVHEGVILRNHRMITKPSTGHAIAAALRCCPETMRVAAYEQAVDDYQKVWTPNQLVGVSKLLSSI